MKRVLLMVCLLLFLLPMVVSACDEATLGFGNSWFGGTQRYGVVAIKVKYHPQVHITTHKSWHKIDGWNLVDYDLNERAGGNYIFMHWCAGWTTNPITDVAVITGKSSTIAPPSGYTKLNVDLNRGAGGDYIYFCGRSLSWENPITLLGIAGAKKEADAKNKAPYGSIVNVDLNKGAGGDYIYLWRLR